MGRVAAECSVHLFRTTNHCVANRSHVCVGVGGGDTLDLTKLQIAELPGYFDDRPQQSSGSLQCAHCCAHCGHRLTETGVRAASGGSGGEWLIGRTEGPKMQSVVVEVENNAKHSAHSPSPPPAFR